jgi:hypothetical protein
MDALLSELLPDHVCPPALGIVQCDECEGTGVISEERYRDMMAVSRAYVDQIIAKINHEDRSVRRL